MLLRYICLPGRVHGCFISEAKCSPNYSSKECRTCIHYACWGGHLDVKYLVNTHHCEPQARSSHGSTPLHFAASRGNLEVFMLKT